MLLHSSQRTPSPNGQECTRAKPRADGKARTTGKQQVTDKARGCNVYKPGTGTFLRWDLS